MERVVRNHDFKVTSLASREGRRLDEAQRVQNVIQYGTTASSRILDRLRIFEVSLALDGKIKVRRFGAEA